LLKSIEQSFSTPGANGKPASRLLQSFTWNGSIVDDAEHALLISKHYLDFANVFPMWHKNHEEAELLADDRVRFHLPNDSRRAANSVVLFPINRASIRPASSASCA
jgi:hypothetical protein